MQKKRYVIHQNINDRYFKIVFYTDCENTYKNFKDFLLLPKKDELVKEFNEIKICIKDNTGLKTYFHFCLSCDKNEDDIYSFFKNNICNGIIFNSAYISYMRVDTTSYKRCISNQKKGLEYEKYIYLLLKKRGYNIIHNCIELGKKDKGIDFIALKNQDVIFIQCKNYTDTKITHKHLKEFYADCEIYLKDNPFNTFKKRFLFLSSKNCLDSSASYFLKDYPFVEYSVLPIKKL